MIVATGVYALLMASLTVQIKLSESFGQEFANCNDTLKAGIAVNAFLSVKISNSKNIDKF